MSNAELCLYKFYFHPKDGQASISSIIGRDNKPRPSREVAAW